MRPTLIKFGIFGVVMALLTASLFVIFGQYQTGSTKDYSAVFADASRLKTGQSVRVAGMRVGTVNSVKLQQDKTVLVTFDADPGVRLTSGTRAAVHADSTSGSTSPCRCGSLRLGDRTSRNPQRQVDRTEQTGLRGNGIRNGVDDTHRGRQPHPRLGRRWAAGAAMGYCSIASRQDATRAL